MSAIRPGDTVRFRIGMEVQAVDDGVVKLRWVKPCENCMGFEVHEFTMPAACLEVVPSDPDRNDYEDMLSLDGDADDYHNVGNAD